MVQMAATGWTMASLLHFLLGVVSLSVAMVMPSPSSPRMMMPSGGLSYPDGGAEEFCQMLLEGPVPPPTNQVPWFCVCSRCKGSQGPKGEWGDRGLPGSPGSPGRRGLNGVRGHPGFVGSQGIKGQKGDEGTKGDRGLVGTMGLKGDRGFKGDKGERGLQGPLGDQGPKGDKGICPDACEATQGPPGPPGLPGRAGPRGLAGLIGPVGPPGPKGNTGIVGVPGTRGSLGQKGEPGAEGDCNCQDGVEGDSGQKGDKGDRGDQGQMGPLGQKGPQGGKGDIGPMGFMGPPGPCMPDIQSAFSAGLDTPFPLPNTPVVFSQVLYNVQGHYNPATGIYTAPVNGTYVLSYHLTVHIRVLKVGLFHNFMPVVKTTDTGELGTTSQQVILHLARGDRVWLQVKDVVTNGMYAAREAGSTFSGFLLHPDTCDLLLLRSGASQTPDPTGKYEWDPLELTTKSTP